MALRAFYEQVNNFGILDRLEIHEDGFVGDAIRLNSKGVNDRFRFEHQEITQEGAGGVLNVHDNSIMMGMMEFYPYIDTAAKKTLLKDIADSQPFDFKLIWKKGSDIVWQGYPSGRVVSNPESNNYFAHIQFKDFEILKRVPYPFTDERQKLIITIAELLGYLDFGQNITTVTSWQEKETTLTDDFLNQIYSDTVGLRNYGSTGDDSATRISVYDALLRLAEPCLLIKQWKGFTVDQLSGYANPTSVLQSVYNASGIQQTSSPTFNSTYSGFKSKSDGLPVVKVSSDNQSYPSIGEAKVFFNFRTSESGIQVPSQINLEESTAESGTVSVSSGGTGVSGSGTSFLSVLGVGDEIWCPQSGHLALLGKVADIFSNTTLELESGANFTVSGSAWHINAKETATFTQDFVSSGNQRLRISPKVRLTGTFGTLEYFGRYSLKVGDVFYNRSTQTWDSSFVMNQIATGGTNILRTGGGGNEETPDIPSGKSGIELKFYLAVDEFGSTANIDTHLYEDTIFAIRDNTASNNSNGIVFSLTQDGGFEDYDFGTDFYGDGVGGALYLPATYRHSTNTIDITDSWRRRGETDYMGFHRLKLREVIDFQRLRIRKIYAEVWGEIDPNKILVYDSQNFKYVGGSYDGFWSPRFMRVNEQLGTDEFVERLVFDGTGSSSASGEFGGGSGIPQADADARYYKQSSLLSETPSGDLPTLRSNIGLGSIATFLGDQNLRTTDSVTFNGGTFNAVVSGITPTASNHFTTKGYVDTNFDNYQNHRVISNEDPLTKQINVTRLMQWGIKGGSGVTTKIVDNDLVIDYTGASGGAYVWNAATPGFSTAITDNEQLRFEPVGLGGINITGEDTGLTTGSGYKIYRIGFEFDNTLLSPYALKSGDLTQFTAGVDARFYRSSGSSIVARTYTQVRTDLDVLQSGIEGGQIRNNSELDNRYGRLGATNTWSATNNFQSITATVGTFSGDVGIGITSPAYKLDIVSPTSQGVRVHSSGFAEYVMRSERTTGNLGGITSYRNDHSNRITQIRMLTGGELAFETGGNSVGSATESMRIDSNGRVGIGTTSPNEKLEVNGFARTSSGYKVGTTPVIDSSRNLTATGGTFSEHVGIGTLSPAVRLGSIGSTVLSINGSNQGSIELLNGGTSAGEFFSNSTGTIIAEFRNLPLIFRTNNTVRARITGSGNVLIGTTTDSGHKLNVNGIINTNNVVRATDVILV